jgi:hypothetical protein
MFLCDTPCPEAGVERILELYTEDAVWEGVGAYYDNQFGRRVGKAALREYLEAFWGQKRDPALLLNVHYLTSSEQIHVNGDCIRLGRPKLGRTKVLQPAQSLAEWDG